jgi:hypothetical protein
VNKSEQKKLIDYVSALLDKKEVANLRVRKVIEAVDKLSCANPHYHRKLQRAAQIIKETEHLDVKINSTMRFLESQGVTKDELPPALQGVFGQGKTSYTPL